MQVKKARNALSSSFAIDKEEKSMSTLVFERYEKKYLMTRHQQEQLLDRLTGHLVPDVYGSYSIANIYYDTESYALIRSSLEKPVYKEKLRLRSYGTPSAGDTVFLELKKKYQGIVYKRRISFPYDDHAEMLQEDYLHSDAQVAREIGFFLSQHEVSVAAYISYDRVAFADSHSPEVRITFDHNILFRQNELRLGAGSWGKALLEEDLILMEIKIPGAFPLYLSRVLSEMGIYSVSFSKYGNCFQRFIMNPHRQEKRWATCLIS